MVFCNYTHYRKSLFCVCSVEEELQNLMANYPQNQDLLRSIQASYYQIVYPVQIHHHEKVSVSTRGTVPSKVITHFYNNNFVDI